MISLLDLTGLKIGTLLAGFLGALASMVYDKPKNLFDALIRLVTGLSAAGYLGPLVAKWANFGPGFENAFSFMVGLISMHLMAGILRWSSKFADDPQGTMDEIRDKWRKK